MAACRNQAAVLHSAPTNQNMVVALSVLSNYLFYKLGFLLYTLNKC